MKIFRKLLPYYNRTIEKYSKGKGYGKKRSVKKILKFFDFLFRTELIDVYGHKMYLPKKGFSEYSTKGIYGKLDTLVVEKIINEGDYVIDVGAAIGYYTLIFARLVKKNGFVIAFEPKKERFDILEKNIKINHYSNIKTEQKAVLRKKNELAFFSRDDGRAGLRYLDTSTKFNKEKNFGKFIRTEVKIIDLDEYLDDLKILERISFMKIDVDGPELLVLESSKKLLKNKNLKILIEWDQDYSRISGCDPEKMIDLLIENDFKIFYPNYKNNKFSIITKNELLQSNSRNTTNIICVKDITILKSTGILE